jgi:import inner membrane translocase subunit TIM8
MSGPQDAAASAQLQAFLEREQQVAQVQQMIATLTDVCWEKCISSPGSYLSGRESSCLENCAKRFIETTQFILQRASHKAQQGGHGGF